MSENRTWAPIPCCNQNAGVLPFGFAQGQDDNEKQSSVLPELGFVGGVLLLLGVFEVFEQVGVEDGGADFVVARGPLAKVDEAAAVGAERDVLGVEWDGFAADGAVEDFGHGRACFMLIAAETNVIRRAMDDIRGQLGRLV
jgi:hypothetical protein